MLHVNESKSKLQEVFEATQVLSSVLVLSYYNYNSTFSAIVGDITWEYAVFRCVGNIDIFRRKKTLQ